MNGLRTKKIIDGQETTYGYDGNKLIREISNNEETEYIYYHELLIGMKINNKRYYYIRNILGEIEGIIDNNGVVMVKYYYDGWGYLYKSEINEENEYEEEAIEVARRNHIIYKGYYYDVETKFFYCNSRYYSPELCRWISPDSIEYLDPESINGLNLYCYCYNNPIMYADPSGHAAKWWQWLISCLEIAAGIALCFVPGTQCFGVTLIGTGVGSMINGYINESNSGSFDAGWWGGQVSGFVSAIPGIGVPLGAFVGSVTTDWIDYGWDGIDLNKALATSLIAWGASLFPTMIGEIANKFKIYDKVIYFINAYNTILTSTANSVVNVYWRGKNIEK